MAKSIMMKKGGSNKEYTTVQVGNGTYPITDGLVSVAMSAAGKSLQNGAQLNSYVKVINADGTATTRKHINANSGGEGNPNKYFQTYGVYLFTEEDLKTMVSYQLIGSVSGTSGGYTFFVTKEVE